MEIAGSKCKICGCGIIFSTEGKFCARCGTYVHLTCEPETKCDVCGQSFQQYEPPKADPLREAILPRALRSTASSSQKFAILLGGVVLAIMAGILFWLFQEVLAHGH